MLPPAFAELFGETYAAPFGVAPIGLQGLVCPGARERPAPRATERGHRADGRLLVSRLSASRELLQGNVQLTFIVEFELKARRMLGSPARIVATRNALRWRFCEIA